MFLCPLAISSSLFLSSLRDIQEYKRPSRALVAPVLSAFDFFTAPVVVGLENIIPYVGWAEGQAPGPEGCASLFGPTVLDSEFNLIKTSSKAAKCHILPYSSYAKQLGDIINPPELGSYNSNSEPVRRGLREGLGLEGENTSSEKNMEAKKKVIMENDKKHAKNVENAFYTPLPPSTESRSEDKDNAATLIGDRNYFHVTVPRFPSPVCVNTGKKRSLMFVGNHACIGVDMAPMQWNIMNKTDMFMRGIAHRGHFNFPLWSHSIRWVGGVPGTREICAELMTKGYVEESIIFDMCYGQYGKTHSTFRRCIYTTYFSV